jgi:glycosyltransferase involved in cell wall biosynthesis
MADDPSTSIILATYERADALELVLRSLSEQASSLLEIVVADDGSGDEVAATVARWRDRLEVRHVWQPQQGFRKSRALNLAALSARGDQLIFLDADCIPRRGFLGAIRRARRPGWFLTTKRLFLGEDFTRRVLDENLLVWRWSAATWFMRAPREVGRPGYLIPARDRRRPWREDQPEFIPPASAYCLFDVRREDFERVNGYEGRCLRSDDGEDQDLAIRLRRTGLRCGWPGPASTVIHLWHASRSDRAPGHRRIYRETLESSHVEAVDGLRELAAELSQESANRVGASSSSSDPVKR